MTAPVGSGEARGQGAAPLPLVDADVVGPSGGGTLLRVGAHLLEAGTRLDLPRGATVRLALAGTTDLTRLLTQSRTAPAPMSAPSPAEAVRAAAEMLARGGTPGLRLPEPGPALATHLLVLIRALDQLAKTSDDSAGGPAAARRGTALDDLAQPGREPLAGGWRLLLLPFGIADDIELLRLYRRPVGNGDDGQDPPHEREAGARTLFDVDFSELGRCQIDALCQERRFDLVVRTAEALPPALRNEIRAAFAAALEASGLAGGIGFQVRAFQEVPKLTSPGRVSIRT